MTSLLDLENRLKNLFSQGASAVGNAVSHPFQTVGNVANFVSNPIGSVANQAIRVPQVQQAQNAILNTRFLPGQVNTIGQSFNNVISSPGHGILSSDLASGRLNTGNNFFDTNFVRPTGHAANALIQTSSAGLVQPPSAHTQTWQDKVGTGVGVVAGMVNPYSVGGKILSPIGDVGGRLALRGLENRALPQFVRSGVSALGSEAAQTAALTAGNAALGNKIDPASQLIQGLGMRGLGGATVKLNPVLRAQNGFPVKTGFKDILQVKDDVVNALKRYDTTLGDSSGNVGTHQIDMNLYPDLVKHWQTIYGANRKPPQNIGEIATEVKDGLRAALSLQRKGVGAGFPGMGLVGDQTNTQPTTQEYVSQMAKQQEGEGTVDRGNIIQQGKGFLADVKRKLVDSTAPIEDLLSSAQKQGKFQVLPKNDITPQIDRAIRSRELAGQFLKDGGLVDTIRNVPDIQALDQYLIAKHAPDVVAAGFKTGRNVQADTQLVKDLAPTYEPYAQQVVQYGQKLLDKAVETGLVSQETATMLKQKYPNYVPLNRVFNELEKASIPEGVGKGVASLSKQTVVQKLQGSDRAIQNPIESLLTKTSDVFSQGERNQAGQMLASYKDLPGNPFQLRELKPGESATHTISTFVNGVKKTYETTPEIAQAAKFLDKRQLGLIGQIFAAPVRVARVGITGINLPFIASNIAKDQLSAAINSDHALATSVANPAVFLKSLWTAIGHGPEYENWIRNAGGGTSFDISRSAPKTSVAQIRAGRDVGSKIAYTATHPGELLRAIENVVGRGEEVTRLQQFTGTKEALLKEGRTAQDANILAGQASRNNTTNFGRSGDWGKALNSVFLYMNAGIQGSRTLVRSLQERPAQTSAKIALTVFTPLAAVTAWNMSDPKRLQAYNDIRDYEKENNFIIVPPNPVKDPKTGKWNVIKVPFSQEIANLTIPVRKGIEAMHGADPPSFMDATNALIGSATGLNTQTPQALVGQFIPQAVKPIMEATLNKNLFSNTDIIPQYINGQQSKNLPPDMQAYPNTSGTARKIAAPLGVSPLKVEQFVKSSFGGVGSQLLNASDQVLVKSGAIPPEQIGGQSITEGLKQRFSQAAGGQELTNLFDNKNPSITSQNGQGNKNSNIVENKGKFYVSLGNGNVKSFDTRAKAESVLVTTDGKVVNLTPPTKGTGIDAFTNQNWQYSKARAVYTAQLTDSQKQQAYQKLGVTPQDVEYDYKATKSNDIKSQYVLSKAQSMSHDDLLKQMVIGRKPSVSGAVFASDGVITSLADAGLISTAEAKALKNIDYNKKGGLIARGGTKKRAKISIRATKVSAIKTTPLKLSKAPRLKLSKTPTFTLSKAKSVKPAKYKSKTIKIRYSSKPSLSA